MQQIPSLQIRDLPEHICQLLVERARRERRSLSRQAVVELERLPEIASRSRRLEALSRLRDRIAAGDEMPVSRPPVELVREDRDR